MLTANNIEFESTIPLPNDIGELAPVSKMPAIASYDASHMVEKYEQDIQVLKAEKARLEKQISESQK